MALGLLIFAVWNIQQKKLRREAQYAQRLEQDVRDRTAEVALRNEELEVVVSQLREASATDPLTGLGNRRFLREAMPDLVLAAHTPSATDTTGSLAFLVIDLDHLKPVNDRHGHEAGDQILIQIAEILRSCCRATDVIVRWGGDEFVVLYKNADAAAAEALAERIRSRVAKQIFRLSGGKVARTSCSIGFTCYPFVREAPELLTWEQTLAVADAALYRAKEQRNGWIGWTGTAAIVGLPSVLAAIERDPDALERDGQLDVRHPRMRSDDTVDQLLHAHLRQGDG
jgi:diguanylate cyclase (GGDEF)-like protein